MVLCHNRGMSPRPSLSDTRRHDILMATIRAIAERGLCDARIADVARIIDVSPALILYYFPSKEALLTEALIYSDRLFYESVDGKLQDADSAEDRLIVLIEETCPRPTGPNGIPDSWTLWPATWELARLDPTLAAARARLDESWRAKIATIVDEGVAAGEFVSVDSQAFSIQLAALLDGLAIEVMLGDPTVDSARMAELARSFARSLLKEG